MVSIILSATESVKAAAKAQGFQEQTVLVKFDAVQSTAENKRTLEAPLFKLRPHQFLVADFWGVEVE